ncbi:hypothetical protein [Amycolatopsis sp. NPDC051372]|uniref:hypothetical protein n=1 Tax=Amycolatopsis sp. NPDC051372 TaxID=3155669 RepID=UPI00343461EA
MLAGADGFYVNPDTPAAKWVRTAPPGPRTDSIRTRIATRPAATLIAEAAATAREEVRAAVTAAAAAGKLPILLLDADRAGACADGGAR